MDVEYTPAEQVIADVLRAAGLPGAPDQILIEPIQADRIANRIFKRLLKAGLIVATAEQKLEVVGVIRNTMLRAHDRNLPTEATQKSEIQLVGQIYSALDARGYLVQEA